MVAFMNLNLVAITGVAEVITLTNVQHAWVNEFSLVHCIKI